VLALLPEAHPARAETATASRTLADTVIRVVDIVTMKFLSGVGTCLTENREPVTSA
jgi:hypothetical protein